MPKLGADTERLDLPSSTTADPVWVEIHKTLLLGDMVSLASDMGAGEKSIVLLERLLTDWNFTEDGTPATPKVPINVETISKLNIADFTFLSNWINDNLTAASAGLSTTEKKTSTSTSIPITEPLTS